MQSPNIHLVRISPKKYMIRLCNEKTLQLDNVPPIGSCDDIVIHWPINPHFTGAIGIASMLQAMPEFKGVQFITEKEVTQ